MADRLAEMQAFVRAAEAGSFVAAGRDLGQSAQVIGKHIASLETRLGVRLIVRTTRQQSLTEAGTAYYQRAKAVLAGFEAAENLASEIVAKPRGRLRVTAPVSFGVERLARIVCRYLRAHPEVQVDLSLTDRIADLVYEGFDAAIRIGDLADSSLIAKRLASHRLQPYASAGYLAGAGPVEKPSDLASHECPTFSYSSRPPMRDFMFERDGASETVKVTGRLHVDSCAALVNAALEGCGVVFMPDYEVEHHVRSGRLVRLLGDWDGPEREMHVVFAPDRQVPPKLRLFIDSLVAAFGP